MSTPSFGRYEILGEVGRGTMGVVYRARDPIIGRMVAIKAINQSFLKSMEVEAGEFLERFRREAQVAGGMNHPNVVKIYDLGDDYMVMEFIEGESLDRLLHSGTPLPAARKLAVISEIAEALDYAHQQGIVHRDIKPANVMIAREGGHVKVMDFGLARIAQSNLTGAGSVLGSASYMAPEVVLGRTADAHSDIFSLGVLAYEVLTGQRPFGGKSVSVILSKIVSDEPPSAEQIPLELPAGFNEIFERVLAKDPGRRYTTAAAFAAVLAEQPWPEVTSPGREASGAEAASLVVVGPDELGSPPEAPQEAGLATMLQAEASEAGLEAPETEDATMILAGEESAGDTEGTVLLPGGEDEAGATVILAEDRAGSAGEPAATLLMPEPPDVQGGTEATLLMPEEGRPAAGPTRAAPRPASPPPRRPQAPAVTAGTSDEDIDEELALELEELPAGPSPLLLFLGAFFVALLVFGGLVWYFAR